jgi:phosphoribosylformimino-5-aminoimidazole carboxamide ribotide isomerase
MDIIPAIDIIDGKCVRLVKGDYASKKVYSSEPLEVARRFESWGIKRLHLVDLDGAKEKKIVNYRILAGIASGTGLIIDFGGGIRTEADIRIAFENGASMVTGGSVALSDPQLFLQWLYDFGSEKIILGADHKNERIALNSWAEDSNIELFLFLQKYINQGVTKVICTDINKDGMLIGPSVDLYKRILQPWPDLYLVASGGVSSPEDLEELDKNGIPAVIIGKAIYENRITRKDLEPFLN